jgi:hypothetical protein
MASMIGAILLMSSNMQNRLRSFLTSTCAIIIVFIGIAVFDIIINMLIPGLFSYTGIIISFALAGIYASAFSFEMAIEMTPKRTSDKYTVIIFQIILGLACFLFLSKINDSEFEIAFKAFGSALALGSLLFIRY